MSAAVTSSVIVNTYNAPRALDLVLTGIVRQSEPPDEVIVADDGSGPETSSVVRAWQRKAPVPIGHVWQADRGFRRCRILNEALRRARGEWVVFLDGDSVPHREWLRDHLRLAKPPRVLCGRRVRLGPRVSSELRPEHVAAGRLEAIWGPLLMSAVRRDTKRLLLGVRLPTPLARLFHPRPRRLMGVNFSAAREALVAVNGFDEAFTAYGLEDTDVEVRLCRLGCTMYPLLNRAIVYHLYHDMKAFSEEVNARLRALLASGRVRCEKGFDRSAPFDPDGD